MYNIFTVVSKSYYPFIDIFLSSLFQNCEMSKINKIFIVIKDFCGLESELIQSEKIVYIYEDSQDMFGGVHTDGWYQNTKLKTKYLLNILNLIPDEESLILIDSDVIFLKEFSDLINKEYDIQVTEMSQGSHISRSQVEILFIASFIIFNNKINSKKFIEKWNENITYLKLNNREKPHETPAMNMTIFDKDFMKEIKFSSIDDRISCSDLIIYPETKILHLKSIWPNNYGAYDNFIERVNAIRYSKELGNDFILNYKDYLSSRGFEKWIQNKSKMKSFEDRVETFFKKLKTIKGIIQVGANNGNEVEVFLKYTKNIILIEPLPGLYRQLKEKFPDLTILPYALGLENDKKKFYVADNGGASSSLLKPMSHTTIYPDVKFIDEIEVDVRRFDSILEEHNIQLSDFNVLFTDAQGYDLECIQSFGHKIKFMDLIISEYINTDYYENNKSLNDINQYLTDNNFTISHIDGNMDEVGNCSFTKIKENKIVYILCDGGLGNRVFSLIGGLQLSKILNYDYKIIWPKTRWCDCDIKFLFDISEKKIVGGQLSELIKSNNISLIVSHDVHESINIPQINSNPINGVDKNFFIPHQNILYNNNRVPDYISELESLQILSTLKINEIILDRVKSFVKSNNISKDTLGIHLRRTDCPIPDGDEKYEEIIRSNKNKNFFLCSDEEIYEDKFRENFSNVITRKKYFHVEKISEGGWVDGQTYNVNRGQNAVIEGFVDLLILSKTNLSHDTKNEFFLSTFFKLAKLYNKLN